MKRRETKFLTHETFYQKVAQLSQR